MGPVVGKQKALRFLEFDFISIHATENTYEELAQILDQLVTYGSHTTIGGCDASILVTMQKAEIKEIVTHDSAFKVKLSI